MLVNQSANKLLINLKNEYGAILRLSSYAIANMANAYDINYYTDNHTVNNGDINGFKMMLINSDKPVTVTIPLSGDTVKAGHCINIGQETDNTVTIAAATGVSINPADGCVLRRNGSFVTLVYEGNERWRLIGELP